MVLSLPFFSFSFSGEGVTKTAEGKERTVGDVERQVLVQADPVGHQNGVHKRLREQVVGIRALSLGVEKRREYRHAHTRMHIRTHRHKHRTHAHKRTHENAHPRKKARIGRGRAAERG